MERKKTVILVEGGILLGIALALNYFFILSMPYGGNISLAPLSIIIFALRRGLKKGFCLGILYGILCFILTTKYSFHPLSILLDYILPSAALGLVVLGKYNLVGFLWATILRFMSYFLSGVLVFASYAGDNNLFVYSFIYNFTYMIPEMILMFILTILLKKFIPIFSIQ